MTPGPVVGPLAGLRTGLVVSPCVVPIPPLADPREDQ